MSRQLVMFAFAVVSVTTPAAACLWDYDTLQQERSRFPSTLELITGKFPRHSDEFYRWRIEDRQQRLKSQDLSLDQKLALFDDMAVAWDKLGEPQKAIELMQQKQQLRTGDYETLANLGTFLIHAGRLEEGAAYIRQAIDVNPDAHFGREIYQLKLVEYILSRRNDDGTIPQPLNAPPFDYPEVTIGFAIFLFGEEPVWTGQELNEHALALKGVLGMMRFGHYDSSILLEALGDLLAARVMDQDAGQLAARAYLRASQEAGSEEAAKSYRELAAAVASNQYLLTEGRRQPGQSREALPDELSVIEAELAAELKDAREWIAAVHEQERRWIQPGSGVDPDAEFAKLYGEAPLVDSPNADRPASSADWRRLAYGVLLIVATTVVITTWFFRRWRNASRV
jgi:tetratricopeptide (TPR) repeat protein